MAATSTIAASTLGTGLSVTLSSITVGGSDTHMVAYAQSSDPTSLGDYSSINWKPDGTPEGFTIESNGLFFSGDARNAMAYIAGPSTGTDSVRLTNSVGSIDELALAVWTVTGGATSAPHVRTAPTATTGTSTTPSITNGNVQSGDAVHYGFGGIENDLGGDTVTITHTGGTSQTFDVGVAYVGCAGSYEQATGTSETGSGTWSESCQWRTISLAIVSGSSDHVINANSVSLSLTTNDADVNLDYTIEVASVSFSLTTNQATVDLDYTIDVASASFTLSPQQADVNLDYTIDASNVSMTLTTNAATVSLDDEDHIINTNSVSFNLTPNTADVNLDYTIDVNVASFTLTTNAASVSLTTDTEQVMILAPETFSSSLESALSLDISISRNGGVAGLTVQLSVKEGGSSNNYLDFNDLTFKTSGWTTKQVTLTDQASGFYFTTLNIGGITNLPSKSLTCEYDITGSINGVAVSRIVLANETVWKALNALNVGRFLALKDA